ncbi:MAG: hypothetical protein HOV81_20135 [Kofleriaceae bacterium]|nr:hypothetical protein [Kofleriaceae bacterium]
MATATADEIGELLEDRADETIVDRIANTGASMDEIAEAMEDLDYERRFGETREPSSPRVEEVRAILEEVSGPEDLEDVQDEDEEDEGLTVVEIDELGHEPP